MRIVKFALGVGGLLSRVTEIKLGVKGTPRDPRPLGGGPENQLAQGLIGGGCSAEGDVSGTRGPQGDSLFISKAFSSLKPVFII